MDQVELQYRHWWSSEFSRPMVKPTNFNLLAGCLEYMLPTRNGVRAVCKVKMLPSKKLGGEPRIAWCDTITGGFYLPDDSKIVGQPKPTGRKVPAQSARMREAAVKAVRASVVYTTQGDSNE